MADAFEQWLSRNSPDSSFGKSELLQVLKTPTRGEIYSSAAHGSGLAVSKGSSSVQLADLAQIEQATALVEDCDVPDEDDLDEGFRRAMAQKSNDR